jgi:hypothetical protein
MTSLEGASLDDDALEPIDKRDLMLAWGGEVVTD